MEKDRKYLEIYMVVVSLGKMIFKRTVYNKNAHFSGIYRLSLRILQKEYLKSGYLCIYFKFAQLY